jgi:hypothetical protein
MMHHYFLIIEQHFITKRHHFMLREHHFLSKNFFTEVIDDDFMMVAHVFFSMLSLFFFALNAIVLHVYHIMLGAEPFLLHV